VRLGEKERVPLLTRPSPQSWLGRLSVLYGADGRAGIALSLRASVPPETVVQTVGRIFSSMFGGDQHLDIIFLSAEQEKALARMCRPFIGHGRERS
jgi:hypothetical protein